MNHDAPLLDRDGHLALPGEAAPRRRWLWWVVGVVVLALAILGWLLLHHRNAPTAQGGGDQMPNITVVVPGRQQVARVVTATGSLAARRDMPIGVAGEGGMVTRVLVEPGQWVGAGQVLATVDRQVQQQTAAQLAAQIQVARANADLAQSNLTRAEQLVGRGYISRADLEQKRATRDAMVAQVRVAEAALREQNARTGRLDIRAPAAGLILARAVEPGQIVSPGSGVLFRIAMNGEMEMRAQLSEGDLSGLHVGVPAQITPVGSTQAFTGQVWQVSPIIDPATRQGIARIAVPYNVALRPGGFAAAAIRAGATDAPQLPNSAIQSDTSGNFVYVLDAQNKVVRRPVTIGEVTDAGVSIVSGLSGNERVVVSAGAFLTPGQKVRPLLRPVSAITPSAA